MKTACKKFGNKESYKQAKLFNKNGIQLFQDDLMLLNPGDILYLAIKGNYFQRKVLILGLIGEEFSYSAILDDYAITTELGVGGFGKVMLGKHKEEKKEVAIKFMDVSEVRKTFVSLYNSS
jgi:MAP/microtubule affinity-regulating kinase